MTFSEIWSAGRDQVSSSICNGKLLLKADEPQVGQRHEDVEMKGEYYHIIITFFRNFCGGDDILYQRGRGQENTPF
jgi:hypothetical protein